MMFPVKPMSAPVPNPDKKIPADAVVSGETVSPHPDYDQHPLLVRGLEHYGAQGEREDRFHIH